MSSWLAAATPTPEIAIERWRQNPHLPRRLTSGITFDIVLADQRIVELAYEILRRYQQQLGPAVAFANLGSAAVFVPRGTAVRWNALMAASHWPERMRRPACLGQGHAIRVPAPSPPPFPVVARWLEAPGDCLSIGRGPLLTSPAPLSRCLAEARSVLMPNNERTPMRRALCAVRSALRTPQRT
ncbi:hypothetical protein [Streptomyces sp. NPDC003077]|uniref:hypothetical protein n=1 Tax=Streptomyces sp. NPDC003077 TaxID=3154443 RepID=UPI0033BC9645